MLNYLLSKRLQPALALGFLLVSCVGMNLQADVIDDILAADRALKKAALVKLKTQHAIEDYQALIKKGMETGNVSNDLLERWQDAIEKLEDDQRSGEGAELHRKAAALDSRAEKMVQKYLQDTGTYVGRTRTQMRSAPYVPGYKVGGSGRVEWPPRSGSASESSNFVPYDRYYPQGRGLPSHPGHTGGN